MKLQLKERFDRLTEELTKPKFLERQGRGNEVSFHIFDYDAKDEWLMRDHIAWLRQKCKNEPFVIKEFDLWDVVLTILKNRGFLERTFALEKEAGSDRVFTAIKSTLRLATKDDLIRQYIEERVEPGDVVFITGVGRAYPFVRSHTVLNNLQDVLEQNPLVMFYPGTYHNGILRLFNKLHDDNYYRAFQIVTR